MAASTRRTLFAISAALVASPAVASAQSSDIEQLGADYRVLSARIDTIPNTPEQEAHFTQEHLTLDAERCNVAERIMALPARSLEDARVKAYVAGDWFAPSHHEDDFRERWVAQLLIDLGGSRPWLEMR